jgi:hypothetical protein
MGFHLLKDLALLPVKIVPDFAVNVPAYTLMIKRSITGHHHDVTVNQLERFALVFRQAAKRRVLV